MRIEVNCEGLGGVVSVNGFQNDMSKFISSAESMISSFKAVKSDTYELSGGVGNLQNALDNVSVRIQKEEEKKSDAIIVQQKSNDFLDLAIRVDKQVATLVTKNKDEFYRVNSWLKPGNISGVDKPWYEDAWNWLCDTGEKIVDGLEQTWDWVKDTAGKIWNGLVEFYNEHKKIIDTILIVVGAVAAIAAVVFTGGASLVYLLTILGCSYGVAATISGAVAITALVTTVASSAMNIIDIWYEIDNPSFQAWKKGLNIASTITNVTYSIGNTFNSIKGVSTVESLKRARAIDNGRKGYGNLTASSRMKIGGDRDFSSKQKDMIREENMRRNGGELRCDVTGESGSIQPCGAKKLGKNYLEIDHIYPQTLGGANSFDNAQLVHWSFNNAKRFNLSYNMAREAMIHSLLSWDVNYIKLTAFSLPNFMNIFKY